MLIWDIHDASRRLDDKVRYMFALLAWEPKPACQDLHYTGPGYFSETVPSFNRVLPHLDSEEMLATVTSCAVLLYWYSRASPFACPTSSSPDA